MDIQDISAFYPALILPIYVKMARMRITDNGVVERFTRRHRVAIMVIERWAENVSNSSWSSPLDAQQKMTGVRSLGRKRLLFDIGGGNYRIVADVDYEGQRLTVRFIGTHAQYDKIDSLEV